MLLFVRYLQHNYEQYTEIEAHAELCSAEALLLKAQLTFIEDETLTSLIKGGIKIRSCFNMYKYGYTMTAHNRYQMFTKYYSLAGNAAKFWRKDNGKQSNRRHISKVACEWVWAHSI